MFIIDILAFFFILSVVVFVHELGHFIAAKSSGVMVEEFGIGFPPRIWKKKIGETLYFIGAIPFGGLNKIYGEDDNDEDKTKTGRAYESKGAWQKLWICAGGIIFNLLFAVIVFYGLIFSSGFKSDQPLILNGYNFPLGSQTNYTLIAQVAKDSPAELAGLKSRDVVVSVNGEIINGADKFSSVVSENKGKEILLGLKDGREIKITPRSNPPQNEGALGVGLRELAEIKYEKGIEKFLVGFLHTYNIVDYSFSALGEMVSSSFKNKSMEPLANSVAGPVGIFAITKVTLERGLYDFMNLIAILSVALGISNLLPIPAMDGAKLIFIGLQAFNKRIFSKELQIRIETFGVIFLILLAIVIVFKDFIQFKDIIFK